MNWLPRFVGPGFVVMPDEALEIAFDNCPGLLYYRENGHKVAVLLSSLRRDRQTGLPDRNGTAIFERDRLTDEWGHTYTVRFVNGEWRIDKDSLFPHNNYLGITGMVPYGEEATDAEH
jgi:hypothetical protein